MDTNIQYFTSPAARRAFGSVNDVGHIKIAIPSCIMTRIYAYRYASSDNANIFNKIGSILYNNYGWKPSKKEAASDTATSFYDKNHNLVAIVSLDDDTIVIDLSKDITAHISMLQSDQDIENEIINDIEDANTALAEQELQQLKDAVASNPESDISDVYNTPMDYTEDDYLDDLSNRLSKLESRFINRRLNRLY